MDMNYSFLTNITALFTATALSMLLLMIPKIGNKISFIINILGCFIFIYFSIYSESNQLGKYLYYGHRELIYCCILALLNVFAIIINGSSTRLATGQSVLSSFMLLFGIVAIGATNYIPLFLGIFGVWTISLVLPAIRGGQHALLATSKNFILGLVVMIIMLFSIALFYGATGSLSLLYNTPNSSNLYLVSVCLSLIVLFYHLNVFPFYSSGSELLSYVRSGNIISSIVIAKIIFSIVFLMLCHKLLLNVAFEAKIIVSYFIIGFSVLLSIWANTIAFVSKSYSKIIFYTFTSGMGHLLIYVVLGRLSGVLTHIMFALFFYLISIAGILFVLADVKKFSITDNYLQGLYFRAPLRTFFLIVFMLSVAGMPFTAGFAARYMIMYDYFLNGFQFLPLFLMVILVLGWIVFLKLIITFFSDVAEEESTNVPPIRGKMLFAQIILMLLVVSAGLMPTVFLG